jgi:hypothetical protein
MAAPKLELSKFHKPTAISAAHNPVHTLGVGRIMFAVQDIDEVLPRLKPHGATLIG